MADNGPGLPRHPGPAPTEFRFPFAEAAAAQAAIDGLVDDIASMLSVHRSAVVSARVDFSGQTRQEFDAAFESVTGELDSAKSSLDADAAALEDAIATARIRRQSSLDAIAEHSRAMSSYNTAVAEANAAVRAGG
jgi:hypothetical protein